MVKEWEKVQIGECFDFKNGLNKGKDYFGTGTPIINYMDVYKKRGMHKEDIRGRVTLSSEEISRFKVEKNDVFFTRTSETPEEVGFASVLLDDIENCVFSGFVLRARPKNQKFHPAFCQYCFMTPDIRQAIEKSCTYTTRALTNGKVLSMIEISLPPYDEQIKISEAISDIDELISSLGKLIAKKKAIKQGVMHQLFADKSILNNPALEWEDVLLGDVVNTSSGGTPSREIARYYEGNIPWITTSELNDCQIYDSIEHITNEAIKNSSAKLFPAGTILMAMYGSTIGKLGILEVESATNQACCAMMCTSRVFNLYLYYYLLSIRDEIISLGSGAGQPNISQQIVKNLPLKLPKYEEQVEIGSVLHDIDTEIENLELKLKKQQQIKQGMMQQLLTGKIRLM